MAQALDAILQLLSSFPGAGATPPAPGQVAFPTAPETMPYPPPRPVLQNQPGISPEAADPSTPKPKGRVLATLKEPGYDSSGMGQGAVNAIKLAQGKSKWGAAAAGLAAGLQAQEAARVVNAARAMKAYQMMFGQNMARAKLDQGDYGLDLRRQQIEATNAQREAAARNQADYRNRSLAQGDERIKIEREKMNRPRPMNKLAPEQRTSAIELARKRRLDVITRRIAKDPQFPNDKERAEINKRFEDWDAKQHWNTKPGVAGAPPAAAAPQPVPATDIAPGDDWQGKMTNRATPPPPKVNDVQEGYRFKGGDPRDPKSWEKVS